MVEWVGVVGLGYVGLPVALAFRPALRGRGRVRHRRPEGPGTAPCHDRTGEQDDETLRGTTFRLTFDPAELRECTFFVVTVSTPVDADNRPDLTPVVRASATVGRALSAGTVVVYGSTVCPGVTEEICGPLLERESGLGAGMDFTLGTRRSGSTRATRRTPWQHHDPRASVGAPAHRGDPRRGLDPDPVLDRRGCRCRRDDVHAVCGAARSLLRAGSAGAGLSAGRARRARPSGTTGASRRDGCCTAPRVAAGRRSRPARTRRSPLPRSGACTPR